MPVSVAGDGRPERRTALPSPPQRGSAIGLSSRTPRLRATASASFVRFEIASRSCCATNAMIPTVRSLELGPVHAGTVRT